MSERTEMKNLKLSLNEIALLYPGHGEKSLNGIVDLSPTATVSNQNNATSTTQQSSQNQGTQNQSGASSEGK